MCWDADDGSRGQHMCWGGSGAANEVSNLWSLLGCTMSHEAALYRVRDLLIHSKADMALILEGDSILRPGLSATRFHAALRQVLQGLSVRFPNWGLLQLAGAPVRCWARETLHERVGIAGLRCAETVYLAHAYIVRAHAIEHILARLCKGMTADGALVSYQRACNRHGPYKAFWCDPPYLFKTTRFSAMLHKFLAQP